jgi:asparagine synthase (glutamine-hydrolysing)
MCGLAGFVDHSQRAGSYDLLATAQAMGDAVAHRGPDDSGIWMDADAGVALSHRRLSILDLSAAGHQPMVSACGRFVIIYNGEVYSHEENRPQLQARGIKFRGHSDTEVMLESIAAFGIEHTLEWLIGMFVFVVWDRHERKLTIVRDRLGIKPIYWAQFDGLFIFGSELKALHAHKGWKPEIDRDSVSAFLRHNYIPAPGSIFRGVKKLEPGCVLELSEGGEPVIRRYWDARQVIAQALNDRFEFSDEEAADQLEALLKDAIGRRMIADVPLGAFLSGGIDSSSVVALMQAQSNRPVRTFTVGFREGGLNEAEYAKAVASHLGTEHTELYVTAEDALATIPHLPEWYDEPFADSSQIPTYLISKMTRRYVTVALSGDGGDELFAGYNRYAFAASSWAGLQRIPKFARRLGAQAISAVSPGAWDRLLAFVPRRLSMSQPGDKMHKLAAILALDDSDVFYRTLVSQWRSPDSMVAGGFEPHGVLWDESVKETIPGFVERMQFLDLVTYLPDDILTKIDRASMAVGLEARVPLLDHRVVAFAFRLPDRFKRRNRKNKWLLRQVLNRYVPSELVERPKMGFALPLDDWLRGTLRDWAESLLEPSRLSADGLLDPEPITLAWREHLAGRRNWQYQLWTVLMLQAWRQKWAI